MRTPYALALAPILAVACASTESLRTDSTPALAFEHAPATPPLPTAAPARTPSLLAVDYLYEPTPAPPPEDDRQVGDSYTILRLGAFDPRGDISGLDTGIWGEIGFGRRFLKLLSVEGTVGYFEADGSGGTQLYGVPVRVDARLGVPVLIFELYGGAGIGGVWANAEASGFSSADSFAMMWDAFIGAELGLGGFAIGIDYRYVMSGDLDAPGGGDFNLEGHVLSVTGTLPI